MRPGPGGEVVSARWRGLQTAGVVRFRDVNIRVIFKSASLMLPLSGRQSSTGQTKGGPKRLAKESSPHLSQLTATGPAVAAADTAEKTQHHTEGDLMHRLQTSDFV